MKEELLPCYGCMEDLEKPFFESDQCSGDKDICDRFSFSRRCTPCRMRDGLPIPFATRIQKGALLVHYEYSWPDRGL